MKPITHLRLGLFRFEWPIISVTPMWLNGDRQTGPFTRIVCERNGRIKVKDIPTHGVTGRFAPATHEQQEERP